MRYLFILSSALIFFLGLRACGVPPPSSDTDRADVFGARLRDEGALGDVKKLMKMSQENPADFMHYISRDLYKALVQTGGLYREGFADSKFNNVTLQGSDLDGIESGSYEFGINSSYLEYKFNDFCNTDGVCINGALSAHKNNVTSNSVQFYNGEYLKIYLKSKKDSIRNEVTGSALADNTDIIECNNGSDHGLGKNELIDADKTDTDYLVSVAFKDVQYGSDNKAQSGKIIFWTRGNCHEETVFDISAKNVQVTGVTTTLVLEDLKILDLSEAVSVTDLSKSSKDGLN